MTPSTTTLHPAEAVAVPDEDVIRDAIRLAIEDHRLRPGTRLVEEQLAGVFGVSRARVRAALRDLARDHLVVHRRNRGACVAAPRPEEAREVFHARRLLEETLVRVLARRRPASALRALADHVEAEAAAHARGDRREEIRLSGDFHLLLAEQVGNGILTGYLRDLVARSSLIIALYEHRAARCCSAVDHRRLLAALDSGDEAGAAAEMTRHLADIEDRLVLVERAEEQVDLRAVFGN
ncbi:GntR family transcriptional regulator [Caenispirillum salinarum]|uniref:GntR family transcriptional regulator n=1 Tax=Caenispirillum salinarum TaxID=859058 RepID=UPI003850F71B